MNNFEDILEDEEHRIKVLIDRKRLVEDEIVVAKMKQKQLEKDIPKISSHIPVKKALVFKWMSENDKLFRENKSLTQGIEMILGKIKQAKKKADRF